MLKTPGTPKTEEELKANHKRLLAQLELGYFRVLLLLYLVLGLGLAFVKPNATSADRWYGFTVLTSIVCGSIGYALGKR